MVFALTEYDRAAKIGFHDAMEALALAIEPALRPFEVRQVGAVPVATVSTDAGDVIEIPPVRNTQTITFDPARVVAGDGGAVLESLLEAATRSAAARLEVMRGHLNTLTEGMGQVVKVDREMNWEGIMAVVEAAPIGFDATGEPTFVLWPPAAQERYDHLEQGTPDQETRWQRLMEKKREEHRARERDRRLR
jgi:hypothetical protein